jgi:DNA replication protein DnaC
MIGTRLIETLNSFDFSRIQAHGIDGSPIDLKILQYILLHAFKTIILSGKTGLGKTHLAKAAVRYYRDHNTRDYINRDNPAQFITAQDLYSLFLSMQTDSLNRSETFSEIRALLQASLALIVDDLGTEKQTEAGIFNEWFLGLLNNIRGKLIITTNLSIQEIRGRFGEKIFSRLMQDSLFIILAGEDYRLKDL